MSDELRNALKGAFADVYTIEDLAMLYADIQVECQKQLGFMAEQIKKEVVENAE